MQTTPRVKSTTLGFCMQFARLPKAAALCALFTCVPLPYGGATARVMETEPAPPLSWLPILPRRFPQPLSIAHPGRFPAATLASAGKTSALFGRRMKGAPGTHQQTKNPARNEWEPAGLRPPPDKHGHSEVFPQASVSPGFLLLFPREKEVRGVGPQRPRTCCAEGRPAPKRRDCRGREATACACRAPQIVVR